jgi:hypothetical protein
MYNKLGARAYRHGIALRMVGVEMEVSTGYLKYQIIHYTYECIKVGLWVF